ncbi:MAG TPA: tRNA pseudouridine(55) synthase TruB [Bryobacteraceae bacterium]|nr:tRNA pseudouridine(55) synthase TruB [Bryobacteraceae bacterium]
MDGVIVVDKPEGMTSHDVVNRMRRIAGMKKVGHLGTLDPMATGVLPLVLGRATRLAQFFSSGEKTYDACMQFGWSTDTYDREGERTSEPVDPRFTRAELDAVLDRFRGSFLQTPPPFSAKKIAGTPAYRLARKGSPVNLQPVQVQVFDLELLEFAGATARIRLRCSAGTYLRGIAHDVGRELGCGAFLTALRRTAAGEFTEASAFTLEALADHLAEALIPAARVLPEFPSASVDTVTAAHIRQGKDFRLSPFIDWSGAKYVKAVSPEGDLIAIGEARLPHVYHPILVL